DAEHTLQLGKHGREQRDAHDPDHRTRENDVEVRRLPRNGARSKAPGFVGTHRPSATTRSPSDIGRKMTVDDGWTAIHSTGRSPDGSLIVWVFTYFCVQMSTITPRLAMPKAEEST